MSGVLLILVGMWGGLIPFIGPYFDFAYTPDRVWDFTWGRLWLEILPAAGAILGGLIVLMSALRPLAGAGAWLAVLSGAWFVIGGQISTLWTDDNANAAGSPVGGTTARAFEEIAFFTGVGVVIVFFAALALGRFAVIGHREAIAAESRRTHRREPEPEPGDTQIDSATKTQ